VPLTLQLDLEEALTREVPGKGYYNLSAHMVWIGDRTRQLLGGHVEYFRGIKNPIGVKVGPSMQPGELKDLVQILNPSKLEGRLVLITRYGVGKVGSMLPAHIQAVAESGVRIAAPLQPALLCARPTDMSTCRLWALISCQ
jgi:3-deoxy-7-phosphoheptulonate synthase